MFVASLCAVLVGYTLLSKWENFLIVGNTFIKMALQDNFH